jgi:hypothetical protein
MTIIGATTTAAYKNDQIGGNPYSCFRPLLINKFLSGIHGQFFISGCNDRKYILY